jgi:hypothetical protein
MVRATVIVAWLVALGPAVALGIEAAFVPDVEGGGDYLVRVEPDLVRTGTPYTFTSDVPADARDVRRVKIYVADAWPPAVERSVIEASRRPRVAPAAAVAPVGLAGTPVGLAGTPAVLGAVDPALAKVERPWAWLTGSLVTLFLSLGANAYLALLLASMRQRYLNDIEEVRTA